MKTTLFNAQKQYLVKDLYPSNSSIYKIKILSVTNTCYELEYESGVRSWKIIDEYNKEVKVIEDLGYIIDVQSLFNTNADK